MVKYIPDVYGKATDRKLIDAIEQAQTRNEDGSYNLWWICGRCFCTQFDNGYYHAYSPEKDIFCVSKMNPHGAILRDYRISRDGKMVYTNKYYDVPTKEDLIKWCAERGINIEKEV